MNCEIWVWELSLGEDQHDWRETTQESNNATTILLSKCDNNYPWIASIALGHWVKIHEAL
jgi:hypothetical protein